MHTAETSIPPTLWDHTSVRAGDGLTVAVRGFRPEGGAPVETPALLIHGNWATSAWWLPVLSILADAAPPRRLIAPDLRGRGATLSADADFSIEGLAGDLIALLDALELPRVHVVGHSLGSAIAMEFALQRPDRVRSLAVIAPAWVDGMPPVYNQPDQQVALAADRRRVGPALAALAGSAAQGPVWERIVLESQAQSLAAALGTLGALQAWMPGDALSSLHMPRIVIQGGADPLVLAAVAARAASALRAPLEILPGVAHAAILEAPAAVAAQLTSLWASAESSS